MLNVFQSFNCTLVQKLIGMGVYNGNVCLKPFEKDLLNIFM